MRYLLVVVLLMGMVGGAESKCVPASSRDIGAVLTGNPDDCYGKNGERVAGMCVVYTPTGGGMVIYNDSCGLDESEIITEWLRAELRRRMGGE